MVSAPTAPEPRTAEPALTPDRLTPAATGTPAATAATGVAVPETADDGEGLNAGRLTRGLSSAVSQGGGAVTLRLTPEALGTVRVQLDMSGGRVAAHFQAETSAARELLQQQLPQLRASLEAQGLTVDRLSAGPAGSSAGAGSQNGGNASGSTSGQGQDARDTGSAANDGRSRGQHREPEARDGRAPADNEPRTTRRSFADLFRG